MLGYTNLRLLSTQGVISEDAAPIHVPVAFRALLFAPVVGQRLCEIAAASAHARPAQLPRARGARLAAWAATQPPCVPRAAGVLTKVGSDYLALLIHGTFNASIARPGGWSASALQLGREISFVVRSLSVADGLLSILGDVDSSDGPAAEGCDAADKRGGGREKRDSLGGVTKSKKKKKKESKKKPSKEPAVEI